MSDASRQTHWDAVYTAKSAQEVSWFEPEPGPSLALIGEAGLARDIAVIDIGSGLSTLPDALLREGFGDLTLLDVSAQALAKAQARLGPEVCTIAADITDWVPKRRYGLWHDRAVFHFLTEAGDRAAYVAALTAALVPGGCAVIATFAPDGPEKCSGLPVRRYAPEDLAAELGAGFRLEGHLRHDHHTPGGSVQRFQYSRFRRV